ncbi:hypothetical protein M2451_003816 [Dysgonomonas sp. PFB1-18]|nr:hypothetical protein [Dysgonomonas sp. PF1-14]MDH6340833.1 hypothetical protein [Dysgonomonas sp. PF1-16]MDH6382475.1 hypothetical protein [Dysgonomonas sp. PFB1-18]MDH6399824.1 hypothetical protein [Dysgonomonas sp. PF1-23]
MIYMLIKILFLNITFLLLHELGHLASAFLLRLKVINIGITHKPILHFFVRIKNTQSYSRFLIFTLSGSFVTLINILIIHHFNLWEITTLKIAIILQIVIELNPFYSDISIIGSSINTHNYHNLELLKTGMFDRNYLFSSLWYIHFIIWSVLTFILIAKI